MISHQSTIKATPRSSAFTLVEIMIVVVILGILAAITIPQFSNASQMARQNTLRDDLQYLRMQIGVFKAQHCDVPPGYAPGNAGSPSETNFVSQMTQLSSQNCTPSASNGGEFLFGPYLSRMPENPVVGVSGILIVPDNQPMPDPSTLPISSGSEPYGWIYKPQTQQIMANLGGADLNGVPYASY
jgi:prepilin-type N-terminal cleavage/methylation domain-containing protein